MSGTQNNNNVMPSYDAFNDEYNEIVKVSPSQAFELLKDYSYEFVEFYYNKSQTMVAYRNNRNIEILNTMLQRINNASEPKDLAIILSWGYKTTIRDNVYRKTLSALIKKSKSLQVKLHGESPKFSEDLGHVVYTMILVDNPEKETFVSESRIIDFSKFNQGLYLKFKGLYVFKAYEEGKFFYPFEPIAAFSYKIYEEQYETYKEISKQGGILGKAETVISTKYNIRFKLAKVYKTPSKNFIKGNFMTEHPDYQALIDYIIINSFEGTVNTTKPIPSFVKLIPDTFDYGYLVTERKIFRDVYMNKIPMEFKHLDKSGMVSLVMGDVVLHQYTPFSNVGYALPNWYKGEVEFTKEKKIITSYGESKADIIYVNEHSLNCDVCKNYMKNHFKFSFSYPPSTLYKDAEPPTLFISMPYVVEIGTEYFRKLSRYKEPDAYEVYYNMQKRIQDKWQFCVSKYGYNEAKKVCHKIYRYVKPGGEQLLLAKAWESVRKRRLAHAAAISRTEIVKPYAIYTYSGTLFINKNYEFLDADISDYIDLVKQKLVFLLSYMNVIDTMTIDRLGERKYLYIFKDRAGNTFSINIETSIPIENEPLKKKISAMAYNKIAIDGNNLDAYKDTPLVRAGILYVKYFAAYNLKEVKDIQTIKKMAMAAMNRKPKVVYINMPEEAYYGEEYYY